jgi:hypothetical protein
MSNRLKNYALQIACYARTAKLNLFSLFSDGRAALC